MALQEFEDDVRRVLGQLLTRGTVITYGEVALEAGYPGAAPRAVGSLLVPRRQSGPSLVAGGDQHRPAGARPRARAGGPPPAAEGVRVADGRVVMWARSVDAK